MNSVAENLAKNNYPVIVWKGIEGDYWGDMKRETVIALKRALETSMEIQVQDLIGCDKWEHFEQRRTYRNGYRPRSLMTSYGYIANIHVPRVREGKLRFNCFEQYQRRTSDIDSMILEMFIDGVSTRKVDSVLTPLFGTGTISPAGVSLVTKTLNQQVNQYHSRKLNDNYWYLIADGIYLNVKNPVWKKRRCVLAVYGITVDGYRELIDFYLAPHGESQQAWEKFLYRLYYRGLEGKTLKLVVRDGGKGLKNALSTVYPHVDQQLCWAHKLRNVASRLLRNIQEACIDDAREIYCAKSYNDAVKTFKIWATRWKYAAPDAVKCLNDEIFDLLNFFHEPNSTWIKLRTTNIIERSFREVRRRTRPISCFQNSDSLQRIIYAIFFKLNRSWENKPLKITHTT